MELKGLAKHLPLLFVIFVVSAIATAAYQNTGATTKSDRGEAVLVGDWRGDSVCVVRESACRDEDSLYHIIQDPEKPGRFSLRADKIIGGKPVTMGTSDCSYDAKEHTLECTIPNGSTLRFAVEGTTLRGAMTLANKTLWRKITLKKVGT